MRRKCLLAAVLLLSAALLSSCALLPEEEEIRTAPVLKSYVRPTFETTPVERGDLIEVSKVTCRYVPVQTASLAFQLGGEYIDKLMVQVGDVVQQGQVLGQLQLGDLEDRIARAQRSSEETILRLEHAEKLNELELRRSLLTTQGMNPEERMEAEKALEELQTERIKKLKDELQLQQLTLEMLQKDLDDRRIYAPFSGTVTYVSRIKDGDMSVFGSNMVTLVDSTMSLFRAETEYWDHFELGQTYDIVVSKTVYPAVVTAAETLGLPEQEKVPGKKAYVYFVLTKPSFELEEGSHGTTEIVLSEHMDVLYLPEDAVSGADGQPIVYYVREDGMKAYKPVETGVTIGGRTEIISGVTEGEPIIID